MSAKTVGLWRALVPPQTAVDPKCKVSNEPFKKLVAAEVTRLTSLSNQSLLTSAATILKGVL
jgi:hypothetical protein